MYCVTAIVIYRYAGTDVTSPAFGSAGITIAKVAYGIAIPTASLIIFTTGSLLTLLVDYHCGCHLWPCFFYLHLHTSISKVSF